MRYAFSIAVAILVAFLTTSVQALQYSNRTPNNPDPGPYAEQAAQNGFHLGFFIIVAIGMILVLAVIGHFVGWRNPFKKKSGGGL